MGVLLHRARELGDDRRPLSIVDALGDRDDAAAMAVERRLDLGKELVDEALLASQRALPVKLEQSGYALAQPHLDQGSRTAR